MGKVEPAGSAESEDNELEVSRQSQESKPLPVDNELEISIPSEESNEMEEVEPAVSTEQPVEICFTITHSSSEITSGSTVIIVC